MVRSRKSMECGDCWFVKFRFGWNEFKLLRKDVSLSVVSVQMMKMSSM